jgi:hypothetical protein
VAWTDLEALLSTTIRASDLGEPITYTPTGGGAVSMRGSFAPQSVVVDVNTGAAVISDRPELGVHLADLAAEPLMGDSVTVRGLLFKVIRVEILGSTWRILHLHRLAS